MDKATMIALMAASLYKRPEHPGADYEPTYASCAKEAVTRAEEIWTAALAHEEEA